MYRCLQLAKLGTNVMPNPMVGAVLVHNDKIIGEGYHMKYGEAHAEVNCINSVNKRDNSLIQKSILYVSLEPCAHYGKTPPCTDLIIQNQIPKVVIGCKDIYKEVHGKGIEKLQNAGVEVVTGTLEKKCIDLNKRFFTFHGKNRPYIILKWAESGDGKIAREDYSRVLISNEFTNHLVHKWRSEEAAILVGTNTALHDNPSLNNRLWSGKNPIRLIIDMKLRLPLSLKIFDKEVKTIIFNTIKSAEGGNLIYYKIEEENMLSRILQVLYNLDIQSVLVEGGAKLLQSFIDKELWDEARVIKNDTLIIQNGIGAPMLANFIIADKEQYASDTITYYFNYSITQLHF
jgi:diaminohydroxyphosphoribosylaminopyrimidine deaminase / 5-amino-6-(5-phosphoribosylamino)uracil reductase